MVIEPRQAQRSSRVRTGAESQSGVEIDQHLILTSRRSLPVGADPKMLTETHGLKPVEPGTLPVLVLQGLFYHTVEQFGAKLFSPGAPGAGSDRCRWFSYSVSDPPHFSLRQRLTALGVTSIRNSPSRSLGGPK